MALEAVVYQQQHPHLFTNHEIFDCSTSNLPPLLLDNYYPTSTNTQSSSDIIDDYWSFNSNYAINSAINGCWDDCNYDYAYPSADVAAPTLEDDGYQQWPPCTESAADVAAEEGGPAVVERPKRRRRGRAKKNKEEIENQRMTHIAVERNRRKQMNDYLSLLRSLMPDSYVQRGDQASIIGGAINFVKELEQNLQCLSAKKHMTENPNATTTTTGGSASSSAACLPFGEFFSFPQYSGSTSDGGDNGGGVAADVEVTIVENHALLKIRTWRPPKQLSKLVAGLQGLRLSVLHLNVSKLDGVALYSFSLKVEEESKVSSVEEIAGAVYQLLARIQDEAGCYF